MRKTLLLSAVIAVAMALGMGCSPEKTVKTPETDRADAVLETIRSVFEAYDAARWGALADLWANPDEGRALPRFSGTASHEFSPRLVEIDRDQARVSLNWSVRWGKGGRNKTVTGTSVFLLQGSPPRVFRVEGDSPFRPPFETEAGAGETPGQQQVPSVPVPQSAGPTEGGDSGR